MLEFAKSESGLNIKYKADFGSNDWVSAELRKEDEVRISSVFFFGREDLVEEVPKSDDLFDDFIYEFRLGTLEHDYFKITGRKLGIKNDVFISSAMKFKRSLFAAERNISIFRKLGKLLDHSDPIYVGGEHEGAIPEKIFGELLDKFPNTYELNRYADARVSSILFQYIDGLKDGRDEYEKYLNRKMESSDFPPLNIESLKRQEVQKYLFMHDAIEKALDENSVISEKEWQSLMVPFLLLLFPKYIAVLQNVTIHDFYSNTNKKTNRYIDIALVDANGNLDIIEIKKPFEDKILRTTPYRGNSIPTSELSGGIMQAEKYIFHLQKWGAKGEKILTEKFQNKLPQDLSIRIANPKAIIIVGRDQFHGVKMSNSQLMDFEIIKRKYANMLDIITYDDLLRRLKNIIHVLQNDITV